MGIALEAGIAAEMEVICIAVADDIVFRCNLTQPVAVGQDGVAAGRADCLYCKIGCLLRKIDGLLGKMGLATDPFKAGVGVHEGAEGGAGEFDVVVDSPVGVFAIVTLEQERKASCHGCREKDDIVRMPGLEGPALRYELGHRVFQALGTFILASIG